MQQASLGADIPILLDCIHHLALDSDYPIVKWTHPILHGNLQSQTIKLDRTSQMPIVRSKGGDPKRLSCTRRKPSLQILVRREIPVHHRKSTCTKENNWSKDLP